MTEHLLRDPDATQAHTLGLTVALAGRDEAALGHYDAAMEHYQTAHEHYRTALGHLAVWVHRDTTDSVVQQAHIINDQGFTHTREAIIERSPQLFLQARGLLRVSLAATGGLVAGTETPHFASAGKHGTPKLQRRELFGRHVSTADLLSRNALVAEIVHDDLPHMEAPEWDDLMEQIKADHLHGWAHQLGNGSIDGYIRTSNTANNVRQEMAHGRKPQAAIALGRAVMSLGTTMLRNPGNAHAAAGSIYRRLPTLKSAFAARESALVRP
jgi:hypothetical protein